MAKVANNETAKDGLRTVFVMQMGQFIDHDFAHSPNFQEPGNCCNEKLEIEATIKEHEEKCLERILDLNDLEEQECDVMLNGIKERSDNFKEHCFPIPIPEDDPYFHDSGRTCMDFHRAISSPNLNYELGKREQVRSIIHEMLL